MNSLATKLIPVTIASILCGVAVAGGGKEDHMTMDDHLKMMDQNGDGKVTASEHAQGAKTMFNKMDSDNNGQVTAAEMEAAYDAMDAESEARVVRGEDSHQNPNRIEKKYAPSGRGKAMPERMSATQKVAKMDKNNDGRLTQDEYAAGAKQMFGKMDIDGDGTLTAQELRKGHDKDKEMTAGDVE